MRIRISESALDDIADILDWSEDHFGAEAQIRYRDLFNRAISDVAENPRHALSGSRILLGEGVRVWHLRNSRDRVTGAKVGDPRHFLIYRVDDTLVVIGRVLHDRTELAQHIESADFD